MTRRAGDDPRGAGDREPLGRPDPPDRKEPRYAMGAALLGVTGGWKVAADHLQGKDVEHVNKHRRDRPARQPLYTVDDVNQTLERFQTYGYEQAFAPFTDVTATYHDGYRYSCRWIDVCVKRDGRWLIQSTTQLD